MQPTSNTPVPEQTITPSRADMPAIRVEDAHRFFFERTLDMFCIVGADGHFKELNSMWEHVLGYTHAELHSAPFIAFVHPDDQAATLAETRKLADQGVETIAFENRYRCKDGSYRWLRWFSTRDVEHGLVYAIAQDITAARATEEQLRLYEQLFQHTQTGQLVFQLERPDDPCSLRLIGANPAADTCTGLSLTDAIGRLVHEIFPADFLEQRAPIYAALAREGGTHDFGEVRYTTLHGGETVVTIQAFALPGLKVAVALENITARKPAEEVAQQQARLTAMILEHLNDAVIAVDANGTPTIFNPAAERLFGAGPITAGVSEWARFCRAFLPDRVTPFPVDDLPMRRALCGEASIGVEMFLRHPAAPEGHWASVSGQPLHGPDGLLLGGVLVCHDVTEQKQGEIQLRRSEARFRDIALNIPGAVFQFSVRNGVWTMDYASERIQEIAGVSASEVMRDINLLIARIHPDDRETYLASIVEAMERCTPWHFEGRNLHPDGQVRWWKGDSTPVRDEAGEIVFNGVVVDITTQRQAEEALRQNLIQEETIRAQQATLEELSTPLIPITDTIVVMPLIGAVDSRRAQQVLETLLEGIAHTKAEVTILDITGVSVVDTQVANALVRAAQAVKLLGAQVMLTGIRPEVAQTLVGLGVDLSMIITRSSLQSGIALAMQGLRAGKNSANR
jgi:PAS domain S-box-containing protein